MIKRPTVLVLGAGASCSFGYPTGWGLRKEIISMLGGQSCATNIAGAAEVDSAVVHQFGATFRASRQESIDRFLQLRPEFLRVGKAAIAHAILGHEPQARAQVQEGPHFYDYLWRQMRAPAESLGANNLTIVTFNYDRSLSDYLFNAAMGSYGLSSAETANLVSQIPILHVHGTVGPLPWQAAENGRPYGKKHATQLEIRWAAEGLRIVHEDLSGSQDLAAAVRAIEEAERVEFLGFGYLRENMERLRADQYKERRKLSGSAFGFTNAERAQIEHRWLVSTGDGDHDCVTYLRSQTPLGSD